MFKSVEIFSGPSALAEKFAGELAGLISKYAGKGKSFTIAISGGSTPELLFSRLGEAYAQSVPWHSVHFFWGDERCVPPDHPESNYGMTRRNLLVKIDVPSSNIHRIMGEEDPEGEALRYSEEISHYAPERGGVPFFDMVLLGLGEDGHTASIFPGNNELLKSEKICETTMHPHTKQKRITITGRVINNSEHVVFLVTGFKKAAVVKEIFKKGPSSENYPASHIVPVTGSLLWLLDKEAASQL